MEAKIRINKEYNDTELQRIVKKGEVLTVNHDRAQKIANAGFGVIEELLKIEKKVVVPKTRKKKNEL